MQMRLKLMVRAVRCVMHTCVFVACRKPSIFFNTLEFMSKQKDQEAADVLSHLHVLALSRSLALLQYTHLFS